MNYVEVCFYVSNRIVSSSQIRHKKNSFMFQGGTQSGRGGRGGNYILNSKIPIFRLPPFKWYRWQYAMQEISSLYHWNLSIFLCDALSLLGLKAEQWRPHEHAPFQHKRQLIIGMCVVCIYLFRELPCLDHCQITGGGIRLRSIIFLLCGGSLLTYIRLRLMI